MKGTIDPVDAIFTAFSGLGGRVFCFFGTCWVGFALGTLAATLTWQQDVGLALSEAAGRWYFVPFSWMFMTVAGCLTWWGLPHLLVLVVVAYRLIVLEANLRMSVCFLFLMESWLWWCAASDFFDDYSFSGGWHPLLPVLIILSLGAIWLWWRAWRMEHPSAEAEFFVPAHAVGPKMTEERRIEETSEGVE